MNSEYLFEYANHFETVLAVAYEKGYSLSALEKLISYSKYFQYIESDKTSYPPITTDEQLIKGIFPELKVNLATINSYNQCLWVAEAYLRIQGVTGLTFECIFLYIPISKMYEYFPLYHEMDFSHIVNEFKRLFSLKSALEILLDKYGYSLQDISSRIEIPYDTLHSLKKRRRDIKKLSVESVVKLAKVFNVRVETIAEISIQE